MPLEALLEIFRYILALAVLIIIVLYFFSTIIHLWRMVPFVPTTKRATEYMINLAQLKPGEKVYDLGCGDGRFLIEAQKHTKTTAYGFENAPFPYLLAKIKQYLAKANIQISMKNFFQQNLTDADVIFCYLGPETMQKLKPKLQKECKKGTRVYSNSFAIHDLKPKKVWPKNKEHRLPAVYLYTI